MSQQQRQRLQGLAQQLRTNLGSNVDLEWCDVPAGATVSEDIYITQLTLSFTTSMGTGTAPATAPPAATAPLDRHWTVMRGWAAAPGRILGRVECLTEWSGVLEHQEPPPNTVLVVPQITPEWLPLLRKVAGLVTVQGSLASHGAILARELGIPAVVGVADALRQLQTGDRICVDGDRGLLTPLSSVVAETPETSTATASQAPLPFHSTQLFVTLSQPDRLAAIADLPVDGLGLLRSELLLMGMLAGHPSIEARLTATSSQFVSALAAQIRAFAQAFAPRPVFYRTADLRSPEYPTLTDDSDTITNPLLGAHGTLAYGQNPTLFHAELEALRQAQQAGATQLRVILPFVRTVDEFRLCQTWIQEVGLSAVDGFQLWIMAEVPAVLFQLPEFAEAGVQGISIGTNDLTQLLLAIDRDHPHWATDYSPNHPAIRAALRQLIDTAKSLGLPCIVCGEAPVHHPDLLAQMVRWGITGISVPPDAVATVKQAIARAEHQLLLDAARQLYR